MDEGKRDSICSFESRVQLLTPCLDTSSSRIGMTQAQVDDIRKVWKHSSSVTCLDTYIWKLIIKLPEHVHVFHNNSSSVIILCDPNSSSQLHSSLLWLDNSSWRAFSISEERDFVYNSHLRRGGYQCILTYELGPGNASQKCLATWNSSSLLRKLRKSGKQTSKLSKNLIKLDSILGVTLLVEDWVTRNKL